MTRFRRAQRALGVRMVDLAIAGGVANATVCSHLRGRCYPTVRVALAYSRLLQAANNALPANTRLFTKADLTPERLFGWQAETAQAGGNAQ